MILIFRQLYTSENILMDIIFHSCKDILLNLTHWTFNNHRQHSTWATPLSFCLFLLRLPGPEAETGEVCVQPESPVQSRMASLFSLILPPLALEM